MEPTERLITSSQSNAENSLNNSGFVEKYVNDHKEQLRKLRAKIDGEFTFEGEWVIIGDEGYQKDRLQYATTSFAEEQVSPRIILYPAGDRDIQEAMRLCGEVGMRIAVRTGGHQYCGYSSTSPVNMQIDLSRGREIQSTGAEKQHEFAQYSYDEAKNILTCGPYQALGDWAKQNHEHGIYLPMGVCANVHLGGHVHTGGWGMVARSHGLLADHVLAFDIILASGEKETIVRPETGTTTQHNDDLYYAVLGGCKGGEFGIVTRWEFSPLRDEDYPNSACYEFTWLWSKEKMERVVQHMAKLSKLCASGEIPSDYEFMLNITGTGKMDILPDNLKEIFRLLRLEEEEVEKRFLSAPAQDESMERSVATSRNVDELEDPFEEELRKFGLTATGHQPDSSLPQSRALGIIDDGVLVPPLIQMWMCFTNKGGASEPFDPQWFESFATPEVCGEPFKLPWYIPINLKLANRLKETPVSEGLAEYFIMKQDREMEYPFVKRFRVTMDVPEQFPKTYTERMYKIMNLDGWDTGTNGTQHLVSQQQIYAGGAVAENGKLELTSYSWREQALAMSHDSFYSKSFFGGDSHQEAEQWQGGNDEAFIEEQAFSDKDMRMFAYTFGNRILDDVWSHYYDSEEKYERLRTIKGKVDPDGLFSADQFSLKPL